MTYHVDRNSQTDQDVGDIEVVRKKVEDWLVDVGR